MAAPSGQPYAAVVHATEGEEGSEYVPLTQNHPAAAPAIANPVIYEDGHVLINTAQRVIVIHNYFFPTASDKVIPFDSVESVRSDLELNLGIVAYKTWGMGLASIWWALNVGGQGRFVVKCKNEWCRKGFSVDDPARFVQAVNAAIPLARAVVPVHVAAGAHAATS